MAEITETVPFDFDGLYSGLKAKFEEAGYDTAEGSNTSQLITAMTYLTSMLNVNTAVNINETILPLATKRNNVLQDARAIGYEIQHKTSYSYYLSLDLEEGSHTIPKYTEFTVGDKTYVFLGKQIEVTSDGTDSIEILVKEGTLNKFSSNTDTLVVTTTNVTDSTGSTVPQYYIDIPFVDVEDNGIEVYVTYYDDFGNLVSREEWTRSKQFMIDQDTTLDKQFIRIDNIDFNTPRIYFQLAGVGEGIRTGSIVEMNVITTSGEEGAISDLTDVDSVTHELEGITVTGITLKTEGAEEETIESIQSNAPKFYNSANRAVTKGDYEAICNRQASVDTSLVWGGDDEWPKCPGHIWFSFLPSVFDRSFTSDDFNYEYILDNYTYTDWDYSIVAPDPADYTNGETDEEYLADLETYETSFDTQVVAAQEFYSSKFIEDSEIKSYDFTDDGQLINPGVWDVIDEYKIPTLEFHNRHPFFLDFEYDFSVLKYNIADSKAEIHEGIFNIIDNFFSGTDDSLRMEEFEVEYFNSNLLKRIDKQITDITGFNSDVETKLLITQKNVCIENSDTNYRDIFIPLAIPFETYFDTDGYLLHSKLPNIDTTDFIEYNGEVGQNLYTDWSAIDDDIANEINQNNDSIIIAPIVADVQEEVTLTADQTIVEFDSISIVPDDPTMLDDADIDELEYTFDNTTVYLNDVELVYGTDWTIVAAHIEQLELTGVTVLDDDVLRVERKAPAGNYILFNSFKKSILIQLYVDATGFSEYSSSSQYDINMPKSYLTTKEGFYDYTIDDFYITTEGYSVENLDLLGADTGANVKHVSPSLYSGSPIKMDLFRKDRYLSFNYNSPNFQVLKNVIPRLKRVTFEQGV